MRGLGSLVVALTLVFAVAMATSPQGVAATWCGADLVSTDRPDTLGGPKWHVIYAIPSDGTDRFSETAARIVTDLTGISGWWLREDPTRVPRFDLGAFPGCENALGNLDLSFVRLREPTEAYFTADARLRGLARALSATFDDPWKKYLVYYDGAVASDNICGGALGWTSPMSGGPSSLASVFVQSAPPGGSCGVLGAEGYMAVTAAHEMLHTIGAAPPGAPHGCPGDAAHICDVGYDIMATAGDRELLRDFVLDYGRDDYYGHQGSWWDAQESRWLVRTAEPDRTIAVEIIGGSGGERVVSSPAGVECPGRCAMTWAGGESVELRPAAGPRTRFVRWEGDCTGSGSCTLAVDADKRVRAVFGSVYRSVRVEIAGRGSVVLVGSGRTCRARCTVDVRADSWIVLRARPGRGWRLARWGGACAAARSRTTCALKVARNVGVSAVFGRRA